MSYAFVFPGQGSQSIGMLADLAGKHDEIRETFEEASDALGYDLWKLVQEGPEESLNSTERTQPALLAAGVAAWRVLVENGVARPEVMAGHSLGEYSALVCAGAMKFADAIRLVEFRGQAMQEAVPAGTGAMAAILGLSDADVREVCEESADGEVVSAVNFNAPGQVVIAGNKAAVERAIEAAKEKGAKRAIELPVSVPSHCSLMQPAAEKMSERLNEVQFNAPKIPVIHNVDVLVHEEPDEIRAALVAQLHSPVRWVETIEAMADDGITSIVECGPGKVLAGLNRRIDKGMGVFPVFDLNSLEKALDELG